MDAIAWIRLGETCLIRGQAYEAADAFAQACELAPKNVAAWAGRASAAISLQKLDDAIVARDFLLQHFEADPVAHLIDAHVHKILGNRESACASYERANALGTDIASALYNLADLQKPAPADALTARIEAMLRAGVSPAERVDCEFALGRIHENAGNYERAFAHYDTANRSNVQAMNSVGASYSTSRMNEFAARIERTYTTACFEVPMEPMAIDLTMIFIVGLPRSGTTLLEQVLASHPDVAAGGELPIAHICHRRYLERRRSLGLTERVDTDEDQERALLLEMRDLYLDRLFEHDLDRPYITDKLPANFEILGFIRLLFPNAVIVHSCRDLMSSCWSLYASNLDNHDPYCSSLEHLAHYAGVYQRLMQHWRLALGGPLVEVRYERLVNSTKAGVRSLIADVGLPWNDTCLKFHESTRPVATVSHDQVRQPIYSSSVDRWRNFESFLKPLANALQQESANESC